MSSLRALLVALLGFHAQAIVFKEPRQTSSAEDGADTRGWTPKPTDSPGSCGTRNSGPFLQEDLRRRAQLFNSDTTCGFVPGTTATSFTCDSGYHCAHNTYLSIFGCCSGGVNSINEFTLPCTIVTTCYDSTLAGLCTGSCTSGTNPGLVCTDPISPVCQTVALSGYTRGDTEVYTFYQCGQSQTVYNILPYPTDGTAVPTPTPSPSSSTTTITSPSPNPTTKPSSTSQQSTTTTTTSSQSSTATQGPSGHHTDTGAIVGGVVGGVGGLVVIGLIAYCFLSHRKRKQRREAALPEVAQPYN